MREKKHEDEISELKKLLKLKETRKFDRNNISKKEIRQKYAFY